jgi:UPF0755 protein
MPRRLRRRHLLIAVAAILVILLLRSCLQSDDTEAKIFVVSRNAEAAEIEQKLIDQGYADGRWFLGLAMTLHGGYDNIEAGGYKLTDDMGSWTLASTLTGGAQLRWLTIPEGFRKEQVADRVAETFEWDTTERDGFLNAPLKHPYELEEGFYFPDTYLIPITETGGQIAKRFINRFNENFDPLLPEFQEKNIKYDTGIKLASIIQREAGGKSDMPLIAGILWNRLLQKMPLEVDATLQYARGDVGNGYWAPITVADKQIESPFNTYKYAGLTPQPIANPGMDAINAVLHPTETDCIFYLHDDDRQIYCAATYEGHLENIELYLRH